MFIHVLLLTMFIISISVPVIYILSQRDISGIQDENDTSSDKESDSSNDDTYMSPTGAMSGTIG